MYVYMVLKDRERMGKLREEDECVEIDVEDIYRKVRKLSGD